MSATSLTVSNDGNGFPILPFGAWVPRGVPSLRSVLVVPHRKDAHSAHWSSSLAKKNIRLGATYQLWLRKDTQDWGSASGPGVSGGVGRVPLFLGFRGVGFAGRVVVKVEFVVRLAT